MRAHETLVSSSLITAVASVSIHIDPRAVHPEGLVEDDDPPARVPPRSVGAGHQAEREHVPEATHARGEKR